MSTPEPGAQPPEFIGKYPVERLLGAGPASEVFLCRDPFNDREVAVKRILPAALKDPVYGQLYRKLLFTKAAHARRLLHPHIVHIFDAVVEANAGYIVMEYVAGGTLEQYADSARLQPVDGIVEIIFKCTRALAYAHQQGVTHGDLKPSNVLLSGPTDIRLSDFGLAPYAAIDTTQNTTAGAPAYMSPEQVRDEKADQRSDIYSLGVVMYQLLTGTLPYAAGSGLSMIYQITNVDPPPPSTHRKEVPLAIDKIVRRAMHKLPERRYAGWDDFSVDLTDAFRTVRSARRTEDLSDTDKFYALRALSFFRHFTDAELWEVAAFGRWQLIPEGAVLMQEGEEGDFFCLLAAGEVRVSKNDKPLSVLGPGECFGEMAYLSETGMERSASVMAGADCSVIRFQIADLEQSSVACQQKFERAFVNVLLERLKRADKRLTT